MAKLNKRRILNRNKKEKNINDTNASFAPKNLAKLKMLIVIVKKGHGVAVNDLLLENGASSTVVIFGEGTKDKYVVDILGGEEKDEEIVFTIVNEKFYPNIKSAINNRFNISQASQGVLLVFDITSMAGVLAYKFIADFQGARRYGNK